MKFIWPQMLWLLLVLPLLVALYAWMLRRKRRASLPYAHLAMVRAALQGGPAWRRHLPPVLFLLALGLLVFAVSRPTAVVSVPTQHESIILAIDVSGSMRATDVKPSRLAAAQEAAKAFVREQPRSVRIGVVSFAASAAIVQYPTQNREDVLNAIDRFQVQRGSAVGSAIIVSLATLFPDAGIDISELTEGGGPRRQFWGARVPKKEPWKPVPPGSYGGGAIILVTDGERTAGVEVDKAAKMAAERGVRVYSIGIGSPKGEVISFEGWSMRVKLDEEALKKVANTTQGQYFAASSPGDLKQVYKALTSRLTLERKEIEVGALAAAAAALLAVLAAGLSLYWFNRIL
ncbi:MAG: VWA domain-containing protein [Burkholderiales bacterium]|nr:VWA domain-containing protein [Burkholderiales bacterium]